jgi:short-subunit dehydrogenase
MARRLVLVTGASAGIGRAFAEHYAARGCDLALTARRADRLAELADTLGRSHGIEVQTVRADLADPAAPAAIVAALSRPADILVNNAGYGVRGGFANPALKVHRDFMEVMVEAPLALSHLCLPHMKAQGWGRIVNVASVAGLIPTTPGQPLYAAAKAFMVKASVGLHLELRRDGVHVTALCPGFTRTEFHEAADMQKALETTPGWMWTTAEAVARAGAKAVERNRPIEVPGLFPKAVFALSKLLPERLGIELLARGYRR